MSAPTKKRTVQASMFPDLQPDKPTGKILPSVFTGTNADLMAAVAPFYLTGSVCDVTYGEGKWWDRFTPDPFVAHDKYKGDGVDFTALPEADNTYDTVCFDPPYIPQGGVDTSTSESFLGRFGLTQTMSDATLWGMIEVGLSESVRVARPGGFVLTKCMDAVNGGGLRMWHHEVLTLAASLGVRCHDLIVHHTGSGPGGHNIFDPKRARRHHSYLLVFRKGIA
jgi:hypothetical protein